jgi:hypothetical protein
MLAVLRQRRGARAGFAADLRHMGVQKIFTNPLTRSGGEFN